jgi:hypothetical protein
MFYYFHINLVACLFQVVAMVPVAIAGSTENVAAIGGQVVAVASGARPMAGAPTPQATQQQQQQQQQQKQNRITPVAKPGGLDPVIILQERENR